MIKVIFPLFLVAALLSACRTHSPSASTSCFRVTVTVGNYTRLIPVFDEFSKRLCGKITVLPGCRAAGILPGIADSLSCHSAFLELPGVVSVQMQRVACAQSNSRSDAMGGL